MVISPVVDKPLGVVVGVVVVAVVLGPVVGEAMGVVMVGVVVGGQVGRPSDRPWWPRRERGHAAGIAVNVAVGEVVGLLVSDVAIHLAAVDCWRARRPSLSTRCSWLFDDVDARRPIPGRAEAPSYEERLQWPLS